MKGYIYLIENKINQKKYIGKTYLTIEQRWKQHCIDAKKEQCRNRPLYSAMNKYGIENFTIQKIEYCENCEEQEKFWIDYYDTYHNGYNATLGGDGTVYFDHTDQEVIDKFNELGTVVATANYFNCDVKTISTRLRNNNISITPGGKIDNPNRSWQSNIVYQFDLQGNYIQSFKSMSEAAKWIINNGYSNGQIKHIVSNISKNIRKVENRKQAYKFIWKNNMEG